MTPEIRVVRSVARPPVVDAYLPADGERIAHQAREQGQWLYRVDYTDELPSTTARRAGDAVFAAAAPTGRTVIWLASIDSTFKARGDARERAAHAATGAPLVGAIFRPDYRFQNPSKRFLRPFGEALARVLHARAWDETPDERDEAIEYFGHLYGDDRPDTPDVLAATTEALVAAAALCEAGATGEAVTLLRRSARPPPRTKSTARRRPLVLP